ncbi:MAG: DALR domain-containing protein [Geodermatophilaceae bacterium]
MARCGGTVRGVRVDRAGTSSAARWRRSFSATRLDIHCGGVDNIFPHHEAEIAQTEGCTGKQFVRYWLHCAHLMVDGQKMSKSLGNFYTLRDVLAKGYSGREVRYALMRVHYRAQLNFTWEGMDEARQALARIDDWVARLRRSGERKTSNLPKSSHRSQAGSLRNEALDDDLNISAALGFLFETIRETNRALDQGTLEPAAAHGLARMVAANRQRAGPNCAKTQVFRRKSLRWPKRARKRGLQKIGEKVMNCAINSRRSAGKCATAKDGQKITRRGGA